MIHVLREKATSEQVRDMLEELGTYIKLAVDIQRGIAAGGGALHADCEGVLQDDGSQPHIRARVEAIVRVLLEGVR